MTTNDWLFDDEALLDELRAAVTGDPPPSERMLAAARGAFAWRTIDADLQRLTVSSDSLLTGAHLVRSTATAPPRRLLFEGGAVGIDIEIGEQSVTGQVLPAQSGTMELVASTGKRCRAQVDDFGCFVVGRPADGSISFRFTTAGTGFRTDWITL